MSKAKKIVALIFAFALCITATFSATVAYLTDTDDDTNVFTVGNVEIEQNEKNRNGEDFEDQKIFPIVNDSTENGYHMGNNYVDKIITVTNTGSEDAYVRTYIAIPVALDDGPTTFDASVNVLHWNGASASDENAAADQNMQNAWYWTGDLNKDWPTKGDWDGYVATINGIDYNVYVATHKEILKAAYVNDAGETVAAETTAPSLLGVYLDKTVDYDNDYDNGDGTFGKYFYSKNGVKTYIDFDLSGDIEVLTVSEAVQAKGFDNAIQALNEAFGEVGDNCPFGGDVIVKFKDAMNQQ